MLLVLWDWGSQGFMVDKVEIVWCSKVRICQNMMIQSVICMHKKVLFLQILFEPINSYLFPHSYVFFLGGGFSFFLNVFSMVKCWLLRLLWRRMFSAWEALALTAKPDNVSQYFVGHAILILVELYWATVKTTVLYRDHCNFWGVMGFVTCFHFQTPHIELQTAGRMLSQL